MEDGQEFCVKCGTGADSTGTGIVQGSAQVVFYFRDKSPGIAAILSLLWVGLGQVYVGKVARGLLLMLAVILLSLPSTLILFAGVYMNDFDAVTAALIVAIVLIATYIAVWVWNIFDAYKLANEYNDYVKANGDRPW